MRPRQKKATELNTWAGDQRLPTQRTIRRMDGAAQDALRQCSFERKKVIRGTHSCVAADPKKFLSRRQAIGIAEVSIRTGFALWSPCPAASPRCRTGAW